MFKDTKAFSSFSVNDLGKAREFYVDTLGLDVNKEAAGLHLLLAGGGTVFIYPKSDHEPASFTVLNFTVDDLKAAAGKLKELGITFERYDTPELKTDEDGICRVPHGPLIAWFKDPAGNVLSVFQEK